MYLQMWVMDQPTMSGIYQQAPGLLHQICQGDSSCTSAWHLLLYLGGAVQRYSLNHHALANLM